MDSAGSPAPCPSFLSLSLQGGGDGEVTALVPGAPRLAVTRGIPKRSATRVPSPLEGKGQGGGATSLRGEADRGIRLRAAREEQVR